MLAPLVDPTRIERAVRRMQRSLKGKIVKDVELRWQGGRAVVTMQWRAAELLWWHLGGRAAERWWFVLGHGPQPREQAVPTCEINLCKAGHDRRIAGAILRDSDGRLYLAHSGRIGGAHRGADKEAFRRFMIPGNWRPVRWPDDVTTDLYVVADIGSPRFAGQLGRFVREITRFKQRDVDPRVPRAAPLTAIDESGVPLAILCDRGLVLDALEAELRRRGVDTSGNSEDLFAHRFRGKRRIVELSMDSTEAGVHRLLGRLMLRKVESDPPAARIVAVLPRELPNWITPSLRKLEIGVATFAWKGERVAFEGLDGALE